MSGVFRGYIRIGRNRMKSITTRVKILASLTCLLAMTAGCTHQATTTNTSGSSAAYSLLPQTAAEDQFLKDVGNLPMDQREPYVQAHMDTVDQFKMDPDKSKIAQLESLLPPTTPQ